MTCYSAQGPSSKLIYPFQNLLLHSFDPLRVTLPLPVTDGCVQDGPLWTNQSSFPVTNGRGQADSLRTKAHFQLPLINLQCEHSTYFMSTYSRYLCTNQNTSTVWRKAIQPKKWRENFPAMKIPLLFMSYMWIPHI